jgi:demethylmenaquinone methyltransferase/2-methoxy-6-polyprenyl-1,4-benzoquinol methylase
MSVDLDPKAMAAASGGEREHSVERMFDAISGPYDRLNRLLSLGRDQAWRRRVARALELRPGEVVCDLGTGTGDLALEVARVLAPGGVVVGLDLSFGMMREGLGKRPRAAPAHLGFARANAAQAPLADGSVDGVSMGWVLRNVGDREAVYREVLRILRPGRRFVVIDMSRPTGPVSRAGFWAFRHLLMPVLARIAGGEKDAYRYLASSTDSFPRRAEIAAEMERAGFELLRSRSLMLGAIALWVARKPASEG